MELNWPPRWIKKIEIDEFIDKSFPSIPQNFDTPTFNINGSKKFAHHTI